MNDLSFGRPWWNRRQFLQGSAAIAAGAYGLPSSFALAAEIPDKYDGSKFQLKAPEANAKPGGVLRAGFPNRPPHFDLHQSGTFFNLGAMACMFDNLIRRDPFDRNNVIPDLAHSWEIAQRPVQGCRRDHRPRQVHRPVQAVRAALLELHDGGDRQRLECHRAQEDAGGQ